MNIIVVSHNRAAFHYRPDSTLIRVLNEYFFPDYVSGISVSPIFVLKTHRAGKAIAPRFVERYLDSYGVGLLLHPQLDSSITDNRDFVANSLDYTTIIPKELKAFNPSPKDVALSLSINDKPLSWDLEIPSFDAICNKISEISHFCSLRIGDFIVFEIGRALNVDNDSDSITLQFDTMF